MNMIDYSFNMILKNFQETKLKKKFVKLFKNCLEEKYNLKNLIE